jgi:hypothetical protein
MSCGECEVLHTYLNGCWSERKSYRDQRQPEADEGYQRLLFAKQPPEAPAAA